MNPESLSPLSGFMLFFAVGQAFLSVCTIFGSAEDRMRLPYNKVRANAGVARTNNRDKNQNWMVFRIEVSGANTNNRNSVA